MHQTSCQGPRVRSSLSTHGGFRELGELRDLRDLGDLRDPSNPTNPRDPRDPRDSEDFRDPATQGLQEILGGPKDFGA